MSAPVFNAWNMLIFLFSAPALSILTEQHEWLLLVLTVVLTLAAHILAGCESDNYIDNLPL